MPLGNPDRPEGLAEDRPTGDRPDLDASGATSLAARRTEPGQPSTRADSAGPGPLGQWVAGADVPLCGAEPRSVSEHDDLGGQFMMFAPTKPEQLQDPMSSSDGPVVHPERSVVWAPTAKNTSVFSVDHPTTPPNRCCIPTPSSPMTTELLQSPTAPFLHLHRLEWPGRHTVYWRPGDMAR